MYKIALGGCFGPSFTEHLQWLHPAVSDFLPATLLKKRFRERCFSVNFANLLKSGFHLPKREKNCFNDSPSETIKNAFYFILKPLFVLIFVLTFWECRKNDLIRKTRLSRSYIKRFVGYNLYDSQSAFKFSRRLHYHTSCSYQVQKSCSYRLFSLQDFK